LQETRWKDAPHFRNYNCFAVPAVRGRGGVAVLVSKELPATEFVQGLNGTSVAITVGSGKTAVRVLTAHAPHAAIADDVREKWWLDFGDFINAQDRNIPYFVLGDLNATLPGKKHTTLNQRQNANADLLSDLLDNSSLLAANSFFTKPARKLTTFTGTKQRKAQLDAVLVPRRWRTSIRDVKAVDAPSPSDHRPLLCCVRVKLKASRPKPVDRPTPHDWRSLAGNVAPVLDASCLALESIVFESAPSASILNHFADRVHHDTVREDFVDTMRALCGHPLQIETVAAEALVAARECRHYLSDLAQHVADRPSPLADGPISYDHFSAAVRQASLLVPVVVPLKLAHEVKPTQTNIVAARTIIDVAERFKSIEAAYKTNTDAFVRECVAEFSRLVQSQPAKAWKYVDCLTGAKPARAFPSKSSSSDILTHFRAVNGLPKTSNAPVFRQRLKTNIIDSRCPNSHLLSPSSNRAKLLALTVFQRKC
jgi:exonuclease III